MTTYGPCKRLTISTIDAIIIITGHNMIVTVTGCDGTGLYESGASDDDESSSAAAQQPLVSRDKEYVSLPSQRLGRCLPNSTVTHETTADSDSDNIDSATDRCGSPNDIESDAPISSCSDYNCESEGGSQLCDSSPEQQSIGNQSRGDGNSCDESEQSLVIRKSLCSSIAQVGNDNIGINTNSNSLDSELLHSRSMKRKHSQKNKAAKRLSLNDCGKALSSTGRLARCHSTHARVVSHSCDTCGKTFTCSRNLSQHVRIHTGEKPYCCDTCGKTFTRSGSLSRHNRLHTGEKPYCCDTCGKTFNTSSQLTSHTRTHSGERPYSCHICGKCFKQRNHVIAHVRIHSGERPYSCDICDKTFRESGALSRHVRIHTGEKPYLCDTCNKTFNSAGDLSRHVRLHTGERPYTCDTCGKTFVTSGQLTQHTHVHRR